ncbi:hypothetical protein CJD36_010255 [Flavipsychrobacter stenotrophus]|uniref:GLPGLI family protein n=1 Tax=Flavipsychrobacter stenotrophus TaxID=2077091 RepID=A0A2S7STW1_9BACT|nr:hypothetical protein [Flavipsychrobacter stenotrophus]PQJ10350.1 hypothetical protein CJD36_010255 [Flavipsychrobacter stenotrophus]
MKLLVLVLSLISFTGFAQNFEGKIVYKNTYNSRIPNVTAEQLATAAGATEEYYIKGNNYKIVLDGTYMKGVTYIGAENKAFTSLGISDSLYWQDYSTYTDTPIKYEIKKDAAYVMGLLCDVIIITTQKSKISCYYNTKYAVNPELYKHHIDGHWYYIISKTNALPLKTITENQMLTIINTAVSVTPEKLNNKLFDVKDRTKLAKARF